MESELRQVNKRLDLVSVTVLQVKTVFRECLRVSQLAKKSLYLAKRRRRKCSRKPYAAHKTLSEES